MMLVMLVIDVVAPVVTLNVMDQRLEVEVWQFVHDVEHDILKEFIVELGRARHHLEVAAVLGQATVGDGIVLVVRVHDRALQPLVIAIADEALAVGELGRAIHLAVATEVWAESLLLSDGVLHEGTAVVHLAVDSLSAHPLVLGEGCFVHVHDLIPGAHEVLLLELFLEGCHVVTDNILLSDFAIVDGFKGL